MQNPEEQYQQCREEMSRQKSELKAFNKSRAALTDPVEKEAAKKKAHERYREWSQSAQRELATAAVE